MGDNVLLACFVSGFSSSDRYRLNVSCLYSAAMIYSVISVLADALQALSGSRLQGLFGVLSHIIISPAIPLSSDAEVTRNLLLRRRLLYVYFTSLAVEVAWLITTADDRISFASEPLLGISVIALVIICGLTLMRFPGDQITNEGTYRALVFLAMYVYWQRRGSDAIRQMELDAKTCKTRCGSKAHERLLLEMALLVPVLSSLELLHYDTRTRRGSYHIIALPLWLGYMTSLYFQ